MQYSLLLTMLYMFRAVFRPLSGAQNCKHTIWYTSSLLAATASLGDLSPTLAVAANKLDI